VRALLPDSLKAKVPESRSAGVWPTATHERKVLMLAGCVQPAMSPNINSATARVLGACGIQTIVEPLAGCCGGVKFHLNDQDAAHVQMKNNIDAWWPHLGQGVEAIVMNASGCGVTVKDYGHIFRNDPLYAEKARRISELTKDLSELLPSLVPQLQNKLQTHKAQQQGLLAFHPPCTLQHGQQLKGGSAGTYSVLQPTIATQLRDRKLGHLNEMQPQAILSANIGCITHLQSGTALPVRHWVEALDAALA
jgi:glycolate oxidase iron-sulfur subunit